MPLTTKHAQLLKSNRALMISLEGFPLTAKLSVVALALAIGVYGSINALKGTASDMVQVCVRNKQALQCADKAGKPYIMTQYHAEQWKADGVPSEVVFQKSIPATNRYKALWMTFAAGSFGIAGVVLRSLQNSERQLATYEAIVEKRDSAKAQISARAELIEDYRNVAIAEVHLQADLESAANDRAVVLKQCEVLGEADIKIAQLEAEEALFEAETAGLSDEKKQEYLEFLRNQRTPFQLTGTQTLDSISYPGDKVEDGNHAPIGSSDFNDIDNNINTFGVSEINRNKPEIASGLLHSSETKAFSILNQLAGSRMSLLLIAGTGGGKTVTQACLISLLLEKCPKAEFWVVSQKNDNYCGLKAKGRVTIFDINNIKETLDVVHHVWSIYDTRRKLPEDKRKNLSPVRLLLADWLSINSALNKLKGHSDVKESNYLVELADIVFNGRDFNVCLWADLQSFLLKAIGMEADSNSRQNFNLLGLGNYYTDEFGFVNESYGVLVNMINNHYMVANEDVRARLVNEFDRLKPISTQNQRPILFSTLEPASICLQADIRHYQQQYQTNNQSTVQPLPQDTGSVKKSSELVRPEDSVAYLEMLYNLEEEQPNCPTDSLKPNESDGHSKPLSGNVSGFVWTVRKVSEMYPGATPEQLFLSVSEAVRSGASIRTIVKSTLKCGEGNEHQSRSYTHHGKTLLKWLILNYDFDDEIAKFPEIQKLFQ